MDDTEIYEEDEADEAQGLSTPVHTAVVKIEGQGVSITRPVDEATMSAIIAMLFGGPAAAPSGGSGTRQQAPQRQPQPQPQQGTGGANAQTWDPELTLGEFLGETQARSFPQKICAAGYYLIKIKGQESFDRDSIKTALLNAHEDMPGNFARDFATAASNRLIAAGDSGGYFVTTTGRKAVESHFQEVPKRKVVRRRKPGAAAGNGEAE